MDLAAAAIARAARRLDHGRRHASASSDVLRRQASPPRSRSSSPAERHRRCPPPRGSVRAAPTMCWPPSGATTLQATPGAGSRGAARHRVHGVASSATGGSPTDFRPMETVPSVRVPDHLRRQLGRLHADAARSSQRRRLQKASMQAPITVPAAVSPSRYRRGASVHGGQQGRRHGPSCRPELRWAGPGRSSARSCRMKSMKPRTVNGSRMVPRCIRHRSKTGQQPGRS